MPHITIEYSLNVSFHHDIQELVDVVHHAALDHGLPALEALRTRAEAREHWRIADGDPDHAFVAIAVRVGPGRDSDTKTSFITAVLDAAEAHVRTADSPLAIAWSIELNEIDPATRINRNQVRVRMNERAATPDSTNQTESAT